MTSISLRYTHASGNLLKELSKRKEVRKTVVTVRSGNIKMDGALIL